MQALFIGQTYIDVTVIAEQMPEGDEKSVASEYAVSFGGNAVTAAFCCAKLGIKPDLIATLADDWLGSMFRDMVRKYGVTLHPRPVRTSSLSFIVPKGGKRAIVRCRDDRYLEPFLHLDLTGCRALHLDGHLSDAAIHYAKACRDAGILTSLDGGGIRDNTHDLLGLIDVAIVSERFCDQHKMEAPAMLDYLKARGCTIGGVTQGERGMLWFDESGEVKTLPSLRLPASRVHDTSGAGDIFHGSYVYSYLARPDQSWEQHFRVARSAAVFKIQRLGNEAGLPTVDDIRAVAGEFDGDLEIGESAMAKTAAAARGG